MNTGPITGPSLKTRPDRISEKSSQQNIIIRAALFNESGGDRCCEGLPPVPLTGFGCWLNLLRIELRESQKQTWEIFDPVLPPYLQRKANPV